MAATAQIEPAAGFIHVPDGRLHFLDWGGTGRQAHLLHANGFCAGTYEPFIRYLKDDLHLLASDVRGHGDSTRPSGRRIKHWRIFADDLKMFIEQMMTPPIIGMGHSLGAVTTYIAAARYPQLFACIILLDPSILPRRILWSLAGMKLLGLAGNMPLARGARRRRKVFQGKQEALQRFLSGRGIFKTWSREFVEAYLECGLLEKDAQEAVLKCDPELEAQIFESVPLDVWTYAKRISCPVLSIRGQHSEVFTADSAQRLRAMLADCELLTLPLSGHFVPMEKPQECAGAIKAFIRRKLGM